MRHLRKRLTYANVMSSIAVFLVLGGGAAFAALGKNTVGTREMKRNSVKRGILARNSVYPGKINLEAVKAGRIAKNAIARDRLRNGIVSTDKLGDNAVTGAKVNESTLGQVPSAVSADTANSADSAKKLDGIGASAFSRQASSATDDNALVGVDGTAREVTITAPQSGYVLAIASSDVFSLNSVVYSCLLNVDGTNVDASHRTSELNGASNGEENCGTNTIASVGAGNHTVQFNFTGIGPTTVVDEAELDVVFIPFAG